MIDSIDDVRVLQIGKYYPPERGGIETHLQTLSRELQRFVRVEVLVAQGKKCGASSDSGVKVSRLRTLANIAGAPICPSTISRIRRSNANIVHVHLPNPGAVLTYLASGHTGRLVASWHSDVVRQKFLLRYFQPLLKAFLARCSAILVSSKEYLNTSEQLHPWKERCRVVPYGISLSDLDAVNQADVDRIKSRFGRRIILAVGRLVYYKGFDHLVRSMTEVDAKLIIVGNGSLREELERLTDELGVANRVYFLGDVDDLRPYYHAADVFVLPSVARSESFGIVQLEAMACRKPVVNTRLRSGVTEVSLDGVTGFTVEPENPRSLSVALNRLLQDEALRAQFGRHARQRVEREFSAARMAQQTLGAYFEPLNSCPASAGSIWLRP